LIANADHDDIAGARWGRAGGNGDVNSMSAYQDADGTMRDAAEIEALWCEAGIHAGRQVAFYCGTGWCASLPFFYAWVMGWERIAVFDGGWFEWSARTGSCAPASDASSACRGLSRG
jgi:molybdopterin synthase sulfurtransferase